MLATEAENRYGNLEPNVDMDPFPPQETVTHNLVLYLPRLLVGETVESEIHKGLETVSFREERIRQVTAILKIEPKGWESSPDEDRVRQEFHCTIEARCWWFLCESSSIEELRIPPREKWEWQSEDKKYYIVNLDIEMVWTAEDALVMEAITIFGIEPVDDDLDPDEERVRDHIGEGLRNLKGPVFSPGPFGIFPE
jgi:hypothetical protein